MIPIGAKHNDNNTMDATTRSNRLRRSPSLTPWAPWINETTSTSSNSTVSVSHGRLGNETNPMSGMSLYDLISFNSDNISWSFDDEDHHPLSIHENSESRHNLAASILCPMTSAGRRRQCLRRGSSCQRNELIQILDEVLAIVSEPDEELETRDDTN
jgi:hypothetical protein